MLPRSVANFAQIAAQELFGVANHCEDVAKEGRKAAQAVADGTLEPAGAASGRPEAVFGRLSTSRNAGFATSCRLFATSGLVLDPPRRGDVAKFSGDGARSGAVNPGGPWMKPLFPVCLLLLALPLAAVPTQEEVTDVSRKEAVRPRRQAR